MEFFKKISMDELTARQLMVAEVLTSNGIDFKATIIDKYETKFECSINGVAIGTLEMMEYSHIEPKLQLSFSCEKNFHFGMSAVKARKIMSLDSGMRFYRHVYVGDSAYNMTYRQFALVAKYMH